MEGRGKTPEEPEHTQTYRHTDSQTYRETNLRSRSVPAEVDPCAHQSSVPQYATTVHTYHLLMTWLHVKQNYFEIIFLKLFQPSSTSTLHNFISAHGNLHKIISKIFQRFIAAYEYFPTCSLSLKYFWNNFRTPSATEITLFQFRTWLHVKSNYFSIHVTTVSGYMWNKTVK